MENNIKKWWDDYSEYYQKTSRLSVEKVQYGPFSRDESELNLLGDVKGKRVIELGCGGGQCSIALARQGAECTAVDFSHKQLKFAQALSAKHGVSVNFIQADIQDLAGKIRGRFDMALSVFAFQFIPNLDVCFKNVNAILENNGTFVFSLDHPFYMASTKGGRIFRSYYDDNPVVLSAQQVFSGKDDIENKAPLQIYPRKMSDIFASLKDNGFDVETIIEPSDFSPQDPWGDMYDRELVKLISPTVIFSAKKIN